MLFFSLELLQNKRYTTTQPGSESTYTALAFDAESTNGIHINHRVQEIITSRQSAHNFDNCSKVFMIHFLNSFASQTILFEKNNRNDAIISYFIIGYTGAFTGRHSTRKQTR